MLPCVGIQRLKGYTLTSSGVAFDGPEPQEKVGVITMKITVTPTLPDARSRLRNTSMRFGLREANMSMRNYG